MAALLLAHPLVLAESPSEQAADSPYFPLGILYLASYARDRGHEVTVFDGTFATGYSSFKEQLDVSQPDLVGISGLLPTREATLILAEIAQRFGASVIVGGPDPTSNPGWYLDHDHVDIVVHHEGEETIAALLDLFDNGQLRPDHLIDEPGVAFRRGGEIVVNPPREGIEDLDTLPLPARDLIDMNRYLDRWEEAAGYRSLTISTSRGCPYGCAWCTDSVSGSGYRQRSPEHVAAEVRELANAYSVTSLRFVDDVDGIERSWLERWAAAAEKIDAALPFEALNDLERQDIPLLEVQDSL